MIRPETRAACDGFDATEAGFAETGEPAIDIGLIEWPEPSPGRAVGGTTGTIRERGARSFGASLLDALVVEAPGR